jgi:hypothetical protein
VGCGKATSGIAGRLWRSAPCACYAFVLPFRACIRRHRGWGKLLGSTTWHGTVLCRAVCEERDGARAMGAGCEGAGRAARSGRGRRCSASPWGSAVGRGCAGAHPSGDKRVVFVSSAPGGVLRVPRV